MNRQIYLDHAATTPMHPRVLDAMLPYFGERFGNPSSLYGAARSAYGAIEEAREAVAGVLNCRLTEVVFTSGGTESVNAAIRGVALAQRQAGMGTHVVTTQAEHHAVLHTCQYLETVGFQVTYLPVDEFGAVTAEEVAAAVTDETALVSVMLANNEVGTINPIASIATALRALEPSVGQRIPFHTDAVAAAGYLSLDVGALDVDLLSLSSHKFGGPKGSGVLFIRRGTPFLPQVMGGGQERQRRAGTENVPGIVGTGVALAIAEDERSANVAHAARLRDRLIADLVAIPESRLNGPVDRLANNVNVSFADVEGEALLMTLDAADLAASSGSACASSTWEPSHVLMAMGVHPRFAAGSLRLTVGPGTTDVEVAEASRIIAETVRRLRGEAPVGSAAF